MPYGQSGPEDIREDEIIVRVTDSKGNVYDRGWKKALSTREAIRFTLETGHVYNYCVDITKIEIIRGTKPLEEQHGTVKEHIT